MLGAIARAAPGALFAAVIAAVLSRALGPLLDIMLEADAATESEPLISGLQAASNNFLLVGIIGLLLTLIGRAIVEARF
jgi:Mg/Co/Ni transporter MgtE